MSLFDDASLVMIPSAYKDGKLYSIKPTDGSGDFTFTRGSNLAATRVDVNGLIEKGRENLILQSNQFDTTWFNYNSTETGGQAGYDGSNDAWRIDLTGAAGYMFQSLSQAGIQTASVYAKAGTLNFVRFRITGAGADKFVDVNLTNVSIGTTGGGNIDSQAVSIGNGWYRISLSCDAPHSALLLHPIQADSDFTATSGSIYIQDAQLEQGLVATDYIETTTTTAQAGILEDMPRLDYSGGASCPSLKLEPQRSNLVTQSEYFGSSNWTKANVTISANATTSPDGYTNADKLVGDAVAGAKVAYEIHSITYGQAFTISSFFKKSEYKLCFIRAGGQTNSPYVIYNLDTQAVVSTSAASSTKIEDYGNGWYRVSLTLNSATSSTCAPNVSFLPDSGYTLSSNIPEYTGDGTSGGFVWGCQLEENGASYASSYIPTYGTSQTRSSDTAINQANSNLPTGYPFSLFAEVDVVDTSSGHAITLLDSSNSTSYYTIDYHSNVWRITARPNTEIARISSTSAPTLGTHKLIGIYTDSTMKLYLDGALIASGNNTETWNTNIDDLLLGQLRTVADTETRNPVRKALIFNQELTNEEAIALTQV